VRVRKERLQKLEDEVGIILNKSWRKLVVLGAELVPIFRTLMVLLVVYTVFHVLPWVFMFLGGEDKMLRLIVRFI
jgi:hypothetical protein